MKKNIMFPIFIVAFLFTQCIAFSQKVLSPVAESIKSNLLYLTSEELQGRYTGETGNYKAANFIEEKFKTLGLKSFEGKYLQEFDFNAGVKLNPNCNVQFNTLIEKAGLPKEMWTKVNKKWNINDDWMPIKYSDNGTATGELVFVGYGVTAKEIAYDDYAGIDAKGKIVIVLSDSADNHAKDKRFENYSELKYKMMNAREHGAVGVIFVKMLSDSANTYYSLKGEANFGNSGIVAIQANRTKIATFFPRNNALYTVELGMIKNKTAHSFPLPNVSATISVELGSEIKPVPNVVGYVKGSDEKLSEEYIVVGAHFDHLGMGSDKSKFKGKLPKLHPGADDNASGVSALIELAGRIARNPMKRSVIFVSFNGEELGLLGSQNFLKMCPVPKGNIVAMLNMDMVGRLKDNKINVFGVGTSDAFASIVDAAALKDSVNLIKVAEGYSPSDHSNFYYEKIPVLFLFTGVHLDYHTPMDDAEHINFVGIEKVSNVMEFLIRSISDMPARPDYKAVEGDTRGADNPTYDKAPASAWFGVVPNFEPNPEGFAIQGTSPGSPAEKSGFKSGDIIKTINNAPIKNIKDLSVAIKAQKPGDVIKVVFLRDGKEKTADVTLVKK